MSDEQVQGKREDHPKTVGGGPTITQRRLAEDPQSTDGGPTENSQKDFQRIIALMLSTIEENETYVKDAHMARISNRKTRKTLYKKFKYNENDSNTTIILNEQYKL